MHATRVDRRRTPITPSQTARQNGPATPDEPLRVSTGGTWIFGYGSLIWRTGFPYAESRPARINGWSRRFWQGSTDHRGVPGAPGRVVTLIESANVECRGRAYRLERRIEEEVLAQLDHREKGGYERVRLPLYFDDGSAVEGLMYHATPANPNYLGDAPLEEIAGQVLTSHGPSGPNLEYLLRLHDALRELDAHDPHVEALTDAVLRMQSEP
ncbi:gamma-glutamylcyclotransferase [Elongatibacter sediminis]|uniref:glutathione-specific gamma-glutamylcyclotransferase n=1 Tax=Elongatibacter sediminis TaxID=3119006 RepID=A0AAW9RKL8_9GAMM